MDWHFVIAAVLGIAGAALIAGGVTAHRRSGSTVIKALGAAAVAAGVVSWVIVLFTTPVSQTVVREPPPPTPTPWDAGGPRMVLPGDIFVLRLGDFVEVMTREGGAALRFKEVRNDSRCPRNVTCVRAGDATVVLTGVGPDGASMELALVVESGRESRGRFSGLGVRVMELLPYPESPGPIPQEDYAVTVVVEGERP